MARFVVANAHLVEVEHEFYAWRDAQRKKKEDEASPSRVIKFESDDEVEPDNVESDEVETDDVDWPSLLRDSDDDE